MEMLRLSTIDHADFRAGARTDQIRFHSVFGINCKHNRSEQHEIENQEQANPVSTEQTHVQGCRPARVEIQWTERELESLAELASAPQANSPTEALIRVMRD
jgi:hypothetical protein